MDEADEVPMPVAPEGPSYEDILGQLQKEKASRELSAEEFGKQRSKFKEMYVDLEKKLRETNREMYDLSLNNGRLKNDINNLNCELASIQAVSEINRQDLEDALNEAHNELAAHKSSMEGLRQQLRQEKKKLQDTQNSRRQLEDQVRQLRGELDKATERTTLLDKNTQEAVKENRILKGKLNAANLQALQNNQNNAEKEAILLRSVVEPLDREIAELKDQLKSAKRLNVRIKEELNTVREMQNAASTNENQPDGLIDVSSLSQPIGAQDMANENRKIVDNIPDKSANSNSHMDSTNHIEPPQQDLAAIGRLEDEICDLKEKLKQSEMTGRRLAIVEPVLKQRELELGALRKELKTLKDSLDQSNTMQQDVIDQNSVQDAVIGSPDTEVKEIANEGSVQDEVLPINNEIVSDVANNVSLKDTLLQSNQKVTGPTDTASTNEYQAMCETIATYEREREEQAKEMHDLQGIINQLKAERESLKGLIDRKETSSKEDREGEIVNETTNEKEALEVECRGKVKEAFKIYQALMETHNQLKERFSKAKENQIRAVTAVQQELDTTKALLEDVRNTNLGLQSQMEELSTASESSKRTEKEIEETKVALLKLQQEHGLLQNRAQELRVIPELKVKLSSALQQLTATQTENEKRRKRSKEIEDKLTAAVTELNLLKEEYQTTVAKEQSLCQMIEDEKTAHQKVVDDLEKRYKDECTRYKNELSKANKRYTQDMRKLQLDCTHNITAVKSNSDLHVESMEIKFQQEISILTDRLEEEQKKSLKISEQYKADLEQIEQQMKEEIDILSDKNDQLEKQLRMRATKSKELIMQLELQLSSSSSAIAQLQSENQLLQKRLDEIMSVQTDYVLHSKSLQEQLIKNQAFNDSRLKWEIDDDVLVCRGCRQAFSTIRRKHHCRACGKIFCYECSSVQRDPDIKKEVRLCSNCVRSRSNLVKRFFTIPHGAVTPSSSRSPSISSMQVASRQVNVARASGSSDNQLPSERPVSEGIPRLHRTRNRNSNQSLMK